MSSASNENNATPAGPLDGLDRLLCPPLPERNTDFDELTQAIKTRILACVRDYEEKIELTTSNPRFAEDLIEAILLCILVNQVPPERTSRIRRRLRNISADAQSAAHMLERLVSSLQQTTSIYPDVLNQYLLLENQIPELVALSKLARAHVEAMSSDKGGQQGMLAFRTLIKSLAHAFQHATGRFAKVTWNDHANRFEGKFFNLCEAVFATVLELCPDMPHPQTDYDRGWMILELTRSPRPRKWRRGVRKGDRKPRKRRA
jgi:hypothetical protein